MMKLVNACENVQMLKRTFSSTIHFLHHDLHSIPKAVLDNFYLNNSPDLFFSFISLRNKTKVSLKHTPLSTFNFMYIGNRKNKGTDIVNQVSLQIY